MTTKNGDMPAMPFEAVMARSNGNTTGWTNYTGLTKREMIAMEAMHGMLANSSCRYSDYKYVAQNSVTAADALLAALDRTNDN